MLQATSPDGTQTVIYTGGRKGVRWATWAKFTDTEWTHLGWSSSPTRMGAIKAGRSTNHYAEHHDATPANEHYDETAPAETTPAKGMTRAQARRAMSTLEDVWTDEGDAVVISVSRISAREGHAGVRVTGALHHDEWYPLRRLTAKEDL